VAVAAAEEKEAAVASAGAQTGGVEETGRGRSHRVVRMAGWIRWDGWIKWAAGLS